MNTQVQGDFFICRQKELLDTCVNNKFKNSKKKTYYYEQKELGCFFEKSVDNLGLILSVENVCNTNFQQNILGDFFCLFKLCDYPLQLSLNMK